MELTDNVSVTKSEGIDRPLAYFPVNIWEDPLTTFSVMDLVCTYIFKLVHKHTDNILNYVSLVLLLYRMVREIERS